MRNVRRELLWSKLTRCHMQTCGVKSRTQQSWHYCWCWQYSLRRSGFITIVLFRYVYSRTLASYANYINYTCFKKTSPFLFLWLHRQMLTDFNNISYYYSWGNLQQNACLPTTSVYCADTVPCKIMIHLSVFTVFSFVSKNVTPYFLWLLGQMSTDFCNV